MSGRGAIDYWCNAFTPDRRAIWDGMIASQGIPLKVRRDDQDGFAEPADLVARMDELGVATLIIPTCELPANAQPRCGYSQLPWFRDQDRIERRPPA